MSSFDPGCCVSGVFVRELKNRFLCEVLIRGSREICYVPSSCHLSNFLQLEGKNVLLTKNQSLNIRTQYSLFACDYKQSYIILKPSIANRVIESEINRKIFSFLGKRKQVFREHTINGYKSDLYIGDTDTVVEIKSIISCEKYASFPTVYSERTLKQMELIEERLRNGQRTCMLIVALNPYIHEIHINRESKLSGILDQCIAMGLLLYAFSCRYDKGLGIRIDKKLRVL